jgi:pilus assembly protein CpaE
MADRVSVVLIDENGDSLRVAKTMLSEIQWIDLVAEATDLKTGYELVKGRKPSLAIVNLMPSTDQAVKTVDKITLNTPQTSLLVTSAQTDPDLIIKAMRAGAKEFIKQPFDRSELMAALKNIRRKNNSATGKSTEGKIFTAFGAKGGVGTTTIATNLAVNLAQNIGKRVVLIDLNLQLGNAALFLNVDSNYSLVDMANNIEELDHLSLLDALPKHSSGVYLLKGPQRPEQAEMIKGTHLEHILVFLKTVFDYIVIDTNNILDELTIRALDESDSIFIVFTDDLPAIYNTRQCLDTFLKMGYGQEKLFLTMNRDGSKKGISHKELEKSLHYPLFWRVPNEDYPLVVSSVNQGIPISIMKPHSKLGKSFSELATRLKGNGDDGKEIQKKAKQPGGLMKFFSRN